MSLKYPDTLVTVKEICEDTNLPEKYLEQIFTTLKKSGILSGKRGAKGGYTFGRDLEEISIGNILRLIEGELVLVDCLLYESGKYICSRKKTCTTRTFWEEISESLNICVDRLNLDILRKKYLISAQKNTIV